MRHEGLLKTTFSAIRTQQQGFTNDNTFVAIHPLTSATTKALHISVASPQNVALKKRKLRTVE